MGNRIFGYCRVSSKEQNLDRQIRLKILDLPTSLVEVPEGQQWILDVGVGVKIPVEDDWEEIKPLSEKMEKSSSQ